MDDETIDKYYEDLSSRLNIQLDLIEKEIRKQGYSLTNYGPITYVFPGPELLVVLNNLVTDVMEDLPDLKFIEGTLLNPPRPFRPTNEYVIGRAFTKEKDTIIWSTMLETLKHYIKVAPELPDRQDGYKLYTTWYSYQGQVTYTWKSEIIYIYHISIFKSLRGQGIFKSLIQYVFNNELKGFGLMYITNKNLKRYFLNLHLPGYKLQRKDYDGIYYWIRI